MIMVFIGSYLVMAQTRWIGFGAYGPFPESGPFKGELFWTRYNLGFVSIRRFGCGR